ncbi:MAG TPA: acyltransferase domain-containing protein, partial [Streptosporangiaceae bacterium]|nr:acyltransferase domain-containing protein [Streptosporangiaceae bacterium]
VSAGVRGRVAVVFPRLAITSGDHAAMLASSLGSLRMLRQLGVTAYAAVGYSAGEIAGLVWAGCLSSAEAARLAALRGQVLNGCTQRQAAMVRVLGDSAVARKMCKQNGLHFAAYETDRSHVLAGSAADVRNLALHAAVIGIETEVLAATCALHTPAVARCAAPMRSVLSGIPFSPPRRPLISTVTGRLVTGDDDLGGLLTEQLSKPVLFTQAMAAAAEHADLIVVAGADDRLAANAAQAGARPAVTLAAHSVPVPDTVAALFAAGAIPLAVVSRSAWHLHDHRGKGPS